MEGRVKNDFGFFLLKLLSVIVNVPNFVRAKVGGSVKLASGPAGFGKKEEYFLKSSNVDFDISMGITTDNQQFPKIKSRAIFGFTLRTT
jgi:hypothetical protein